VTARVSAVMAALVMAGCSSGTTSKGYEPCPAGQRFTEEPGYAGAGNRGVLRIVEGGTLESIDARVLGQGNGDGAPSVFGRVQPLPGAVLEKVDLVRTALPRGARSQGQAHFKIPDGAKISLFARSGVKGYGWNFRVGGTKASFNVRCLADRPRHVVDWQFSLRDDQGRQSNAIQIPVTCTGDPMPGSAPQLDAVDLDYDNLVAGQKTGGVARLRGTSTPLTFIAASTNWGYGWESSPISKTETDLNFAVGCRKDREPQVVRWRFSVKDSWGRVSNVIEKPVHCGLCVAR
jgi:hypothetical protein